MADRLQEKSVNYSCTKDQMPAGGASGGYSDSYRDIINISLYMWLVYMDHGMMIISKLKQYKTCRMSVEIASTVLNEKH